MMVEKFHLARKPFIIFPDTGVLFAKPNLALSHNDMLVSLKLEPLYIKYIIDNFPRGYFMNNNLVFYQGNSLTPGDVWHVSKENIKTILERFFNLDKKTWIYLGLRVGEPGKVWELINKISIDKLRGKSK